MTENSQPLFMASNNMFIKKMNGFYLILNPDAPNIMVSNKLGKKILEFCDGQLSLNDITERLTSGNRIDEASLKQYIHSLIKASFISKNPPPSVQGRLIKEPQIGFLILHVTESCNLRCKHCYFECEKASENEMGIGEYLRIVNEFVELGGISLLLTGGEPLLRRDILFGTVKHARDYAEIGRIVVDTNGTLLTETDAKLFAKYDVDVGVSLDGATSDTHDFIRGKGAYDKTIKAIEKLVNAGAKVTTGTTLMKPNFKEFKSIIRLGKELGVDSVNFNMLKVSGRAKDNEKEIVCSVEDVLSTVKKILKASKEIEMKTSIETMELDLKKLESGTDLCGAGTTVLSISANGDVYPCDALYFDKLKAGNIRTQKLNDIWKNSPVLKIFRDLSVTRIEGCKDCEIKFICGGACLAERYDLYKSFEKCTPMCPVYKAIHWFFISKIASEMWEELG